VDVLALLFLVGDNLGSADLAPQLSRKQTGFLAKLTCAPARPASVGLL
jgi:hypothetical protein